MCVDDNNNYSNPYNMDPEMSIQRRWERICREIGEISMQKL